MGTDGRLWVAGALAGLVGLSALREARRSEPRRIEQPDREARRGYQGSQGSRGVVRRGRSNDQSPSQDVVDRWPQRFVVPLNRSDLPSVAIAVGSRAERMSTRDPTSWLIGSIDAMDGPNDEVLKAIASGSSLLESLLVRGEREEWETPQWDGERAGGRTIAGKAIGDDGDACIMALRRGFSLARIPDNLTDSYYRWYLIHPLPQDQTWWSVERGGTPAVLSATLMTVLRGAKKLLPGFTVPVREVPYG